MSGDDLSLLGAFAREQSQDAFATLVQRHLNLVYCAALRQVRSPQLAEEVAQSVFTDLAREAGRMEPGSVLTAWLYQVTRRTAIDVVRRESRRQLREQVALEMNAMDATADDWKKIEPLLDEAMDALDEGDRTAVLLRYFENKSLREVGAALGTSDDAARKRVSRAVERLRDFFTAQGVHVSAGGFILVISANAVQAAPAGLALTISTTVALAGTAVATTGLAAATTTIAMTTLQKTLVTTVLVAVIGAGVYQLRQNSSLRVRNHQLQTERAALLEQIEQARLELDAATNRALALAASLTEERNSRTNASEVMKLRGQVGVLRQERAELGRQSPLNKITADPEGRRLMRSQQKMGMSALYSELVKRLKLSPEEKGRFDDLLADDVMDGIDLITRTLFDKNSRAEVNQLFTAREQAFRDKVSALLGPDGLAQYQEYSKHLASTLTAAQFEPSLSGEAPEKAEKKRQLLDLMREETQASLTAAGLPEDFQTLPMLNFRNIASEEQAEIGLKLMDDTFQRAAARAAAFLSPEELLKFQEFRAKALENNRTMLSMNRKMMAPITQ